ncbi:4Fe-4S binding domain protein [Desulfamplus magnetovallimortis]|uniref:4Fe-4S binding domain protein n=1 Tax=Desulfamplus magnetovallimortis TaxID=1246637 RepID=A0A1W1H8N3_9BACT|nr:4Fe-4S dicluster domain-containing protein [Desulfamplus magnetovallimortis]SLM28831.1 4Fe-4S binding domain protein [Desulfamplus magnetovallimortis]
MKEVIVRPERCVGCMQCMLACAKAHSTSGELYLATLENPVPKPRIHVGAGRFNEGFPNRCRHCNPAPCQTACLAGAIFRDSLTNSVLIDPSRCINCASCAMACPYGVIRFHQDTFAPYNKTVAVKCDNCDARISEGRIPACVEACKTGALVYEELSQAMKRKNSEVSRAMSPPSEYCSSIIPSEVALLKSMKESCCKLKSPL